MRVYLKKKDRLIYSHSIVVTLYFILDEINFASNGIYNDIYNKQTAIIFKSPKIFGKYAVLSIIHSELMRNVVQ